MGIKERQLDACLRSQIENNRAKAVGAYMVSTMLGRGKYGTAYQACKDDDCERVIKFVMLEDDDDRMEFQKEARTSKLMGDLGIGPRIYEIEQYTTPNCSVGVIVMDRLYQTMKDKEALGGLSEDQMAKLFQKIQRMHDAGYIHGDLHRRNVMLDENGDVYIIDFGFGTKKTDVAGLKSTLRGYKLSSLSSSYPTKQFSTWDRTRALDYSRLGSVFRQFARSKGATVYDKVEVI